MFRVMQGNPREEKPAKYPECNVDPSWNKYEYNTYDEALSYAVKWLGSFAPDNIALLAVDNKWTYGYGEGDYVVIRQVENQKQEFYWELNTVGSHKIQMQYDRDIGRAYIHGTAVSMEDLLELMIALEKARK